MPKKVLVKDGITYKGTKRYLAMLEKHDIFQTYALEDAVKRVREVATAKFDETIELHYLLNIKQKHTIRDVLVMPHSVGREKKVLVFAQGDKAAEAKDAGADFVGGEDLAEKILGGWLEFDAVIATPDMMKVVGKLGAILGRRKMMPNPKTGTVTMDLTKVVKEYKAGRVEIRADKTGNIHAVIGKKSSSEQALLENTLAIHKLLMKNRPTDLKGEYMASMNLAPTMGLVVPVDFKKISV
ncbi:MAG: 50S ribosomal protein L1 [Brevinematales bacterium]|nr:50S ribosomal protein L1 [Brevinematales bacterium]